MRACVSAASLLLGQLIAYQAFAQSEAVDPDRPEEIYERDLIVRALDLLKLTLEPEPRGKRIERIEIVRFPIIEESDPWPGFLNALHITTREQIVRQELLFEEGAIYDEVQVLETARNLRLMPLLFSTVRIVSALGSRGDKVVVVVITKDLWSIRMNSNGSFGGGSFNYYQWTPSEQNFLGYNQQVSLHYTIDRTVQAFGEIYRVPRLFGTRLMLQEFLALRVNHQTGAVEGGWGTFTLAQPLYAREAEWGFALQAAFDVGIDRFYEGPRLREREFPGEGGVTLFLPEMYRRQSYLVSALAVRSFGRDQKIDLTFGYEARARLYQVTDGFELLPLSVRQAFEDEVLPVDDATGALVGAVRFYEPHFARLQNVQTLGLSEDFRLGADLSLRLDYYVPIGFSQHGLRLDLNFDYNWFRAGNLLSFSGRATARILQDQTIYKETPLIDQLYTAELKDITPTLFGLGRFFFRIAYVYSQYWLNRTRFTLGGENTLRGFITGFQSGPRVFNVNAEFRTLPWVLATIHLGLVLFYDGGDAYGSADAPDFRYHHAVGLGFRSLAPQLDRGCLRLDIGVPLGDDFHSHVIDWVTISFNQAF